MFNIKQIPFSRYGSYLSISFLKKRANLDEGVYLRNIRGGDNHHGAIFKIEVIENGKSVEYETEQTATKLTFKTKRGYVSFIHPQSTRMRFEGENIGLRLTMPIGGYDNIFSHREEQWEVNAFSKNIRLMLKCLEGEVNVDSPWNVNGCERMVVDYLPREGRTYIAGTIEEFVTTYNEVVTNKSFNEEHEAICDEFADWDRNVLTTPNELSNGRKFASYITWSSVVRKEGFLTRDAMYMSKNWMTNIWSWDHCFNAMALAKNNPKLAWDQLMIFFDVQDEAGLLPDFMNDQFAYWNCSKPPIHGWTLSWIMKRMENELSKSQLKEVYAPMTKWTKWYENYRITQTNGLPEYHHGNDSGWDNSTVFAKGIPVESPDLTAFLVLQTETLATIARRLQLEVEANTWEKKSNQLRERLIERFWDGEAFYARYNGERFDYGDSLLLFMPIVLGNRLPKDIIKKLVAGLKENDRFLTANGLATESKKSPYYIDDGYWRGPIWAPSSMLLIDGLKEAGEVEFARDLAKRFCKMANKNGMAENYDAITGEGLRDRAFTWTSSVYLILANEYIN